MPQRLLLLQVWEVDAAVAAVSSGAEPEYADSKACWKHAMRGEGPG